MNIKPVVVLGWGKTACRLISALPDSQEGLLMSGGFGTAPFLESGPVSLDFEGDDKTGAYINSRVIELVSKIEKNRLAYAEKNIHVPRTIQIVVVVPLFEQFDIKRFSAFCACLRKAAHLARTYSMDIILFGIMPGVDFPGADREMAGNNLKLLEGLFCTEAENKPFRLVSLAEIPQAQMEIEFSENSRIVKALQLLCMDEDHITALDTVTTATSSRLIDGHPCLFGSTGVFALQYEPQKTFDMMSGIMRCDCLQTAIIGMEDALRNDLAAIAQNTNLEPLVRPACELAGKTAEKEILNDDIDACDTIEQISILYGRIKADAIAPCNSEYEKILLSTLPGFLTKTSENYLLLCEHLVRYVRASHTLIEKVNADTADRICKAFSLPQNAEAIVARLKELESKESLVESEWRLLIAIQLFALLVNTETTVSAYNVILAMLDKLMHNLSDAKTVLEQAETTHSALLEEHRKFEASWNFTRRLMHKNEYEKEKSIFSDRIAQSEKNLIIIKNGINIILNQKRILCVEFFPCYILPGVVAEAMEQVLHRSCDEILVWTASIHNTLSQWSNGTSVHISYDSNWKEHAIRPDNREQWYKRFRPEIVIMRNEFMDFHEKSTKNPFSIGAFACTKDSSFLDTVTSYSRVRMEPFVSLTMIDFLVDESGVPRNQVINTLFEKAAPQAQRNQSLAFPADELTKIECFHASSNTLFKLDSVLQYREKLLKNEIADKNKVMVFTMEYGYPAGFVEGFAYKASRST